MPRPRQRRPASAPAAAPSASHAKLETQVESTRAGQPAEQAPSPTTAAAPIAPLVPVGVGLDTARYGHHASFLADDLQDADDDLDFVESGAGYQLFRARLDALVAKHGNVHFHFRVDVAGR
jgi:hypothetical protein